MPIYEYRCENGHTFEVMQRMTDEPVQVCQTCTATVQRVFHPVAVHFKGSGFYNTDYGKRKRGGDTSSDTASSESKAEKSEKKTEAKKDGKSSTGDSKPSGSSTSSSG